MDLELNEEQLMLREGLQKLLAAECPTKLVRKMESDPIGYSPDLWRALAEMGIAGLTIPDDAGGSGQSAIELAIVHEELGKALCPSPLLESAVISAELLMCAGSAEQKKQWLPVIASGEAVLVPAWLEPGNSFGPRGVRLPAVAGAGGIILSGVKFCVPFAAAAQRLLVLARTGPADRDIDILMVDPKASGVSMTQLRTMDGDAQYEVKFDGVVVHDGDRIGGRGQGWAWWGAAMNTANIALGAWAVGCGTRAHELAVQYAKERVQFGRPIGSFQAMSHPLANIAMELEGARALVLQAAWASAVGKPFSHLAAMAKLNAEAACTHATGMAHQVFGGIGFTVDIDVQLYFRRARQNRFAWGAPNDLRETIAASILDGEH
jgi:alkylation response protein AidB-like acyl-CoA dehydrogenase